LVIRSLTVLKIRRDIAILARRPPLQRPSCPRCVHSLLGNSCRFKVKPVRNGMGGRLSPPSRIAWTHIIPWHERVFIFYPLTCSEGTAVLLCGYLRKSHCRKMFARKVASVRKHRAVIFVEAVVYLRITSGERSTRIVINRFINSNYPCVGPGVPPLVVYLILATAIINHKLVQS
jgi:hypothetical protein